MIFTYYLTEKSFKIQKATGLDTILQLKVKMANIISCFATKNNSQKDLIKMYSSAKAKIKLSVKIKPVKLSEKFFFVA